MFVTLVENDALARVKVLAVASKFVVRVDKLPLTVEKLAETKANEAEAVVKVLAVLSKLAVLPTIDPEKVLKELVRV